MSQVMPCTTIIIRHFAPSVSIIADDVESVLSHRATTTVRCSKKPIAISGEARLIQLFPDAHIPFLCLSRRASRSGIAISNNPHSCKTAHSLPRLRSIRLQ
ncbi:hypothetical protein ACE10Z_36365 [Bradyrhizobium sp. Pha-3]|uniref:hypothetical protein n=1 Tax=Bradyrhizobium sp. Pha-3 TaxID=208375 RepID=UPI0035D3E344